MGGNKILGVKTPEIPLSSFLFKGKSFDESLRTSGSPIEQSINKWLLKEVVKPVKGWFGGGGGSSYAPMTKGLSSNPQYFAQQQQMLANMRQQQQAKLANLRTKGEVYPSAAYASTQTAQPDQKPQTTTTAPSTTALAQTKVGDTTAPADMPTEFIYKPATATTKSVAANTFQIPDMSNIKFGGV